MSSGSKRQSHHQHHGGGARPRNLPALIEALLEPGLYPHPVSAVDLVETHISYLLLAGDYAYKIKKPVNLGFLDFTTLESRRHYCNEEVRLNRRTAPGIYLDTIAITGTDKAPVLGGNGSAIEYAVRMRRFPQDALLDNLARRGALRHRHVIALADIVARFHDAVDRARAENPALSARTVLAPAMQNFDQICALLTHGPGWAAMDALRGWTESEFTSREKFFEGRAGGGFVRECHGDLHLGNVALIDDEPVPFDCIEFNTAFRWIDVMNEIAFMVMDLLDHGLSQFAYGFLNRYLETTGDYAGLRVLRFYLVYRAMVRAKVALIRARQSADARSEEDFVRHVALANTVSSSVSPALIVMHGVSGSGKSTLARILADQLGAVRLRSDVERKRLHGLVASARSGAAPDRGIYTPGDTERTYQRLAEFARASLESGYPTIVDATCLKRAQRERFRHLAADCGVAYALVTCGAPDDILRQRVAQREREGSDASEASLAVLDRQCQTQDPLTQEELALAVPVDTRRDGDSFDHATALLARRLGLEVLPA